MGLHQVAEYSQARFGGLRGMIVLNQLARDILDGVEQRFERGFSSHNPSMSLCTT
jgi:hypothetical protein